MGLVTRQIDHARGGETDRLVGGMAVPQLDALARLYDPGLERIELLQRVAGPVQRLDGRVECADVGPRRHFLQAIGAELQPTRERRRDRSIVDLPAEIEVAARQS